MTDNEIIKGAECCTSTYCFSCPYDDNGCLMALHKDTLDLINRQKAETERLQNNYVNTAKHCLLLIQENTNNVIKEFVERLDKSLCENIGPSRRLYWKISADIDNLVKEMVGDG